jgi:hypothetical protein
VDVAKTEAGYPAVKAPTEKRDAIFNASKMKHIDEKAKQVMLYPSMLSTLFTVFC